MNDTDPTRAQTLSRDDILGLLTEVGAHIDGLGLRGEMFVVGGAAMALAYNTRRLTADVDGSARLQPKAQFLVQQLFPAR